MKEAIDTLTSVAAQTMMQHPPDTLDLMQRGVIYGLTTAVGILLDPPQSPLSGIDLGAYAQAGMTHVQQEVAQWPPTS